MSRATLYKWRSKYGGMDAWNSGDRNSGDTILNYLILCGKVAILGLWIGWIMYYVPRIAKANEYDFLKGDAFYGLYIYGTKINPLNQDSSSQHKFYRYFWFLSLILADIGVIFYIVKFSWLFNWWTVTVIPVGVRGTQYLIIWFYSEKLPFWANE